MLHTVFLVLHLIGAVGLFGIFAGAIVAIIKKTSKAYRSLFNSVIMIDVAQLISGIALFLTPANTMSGTQLCVRFAVYMVLSAAVEYVLYRQMVQEDVAVIAHTVRKGSK